MEEHLILLPLQVDSSVEESILKEFTMSALDLVEEELPILKKIKIDLNTKLNLSTILIPLKILLLKKK